MMLVDLTSKLPRGIVLDVIVKIEDFYYPVDFLVLDYVAKDPTKQPTVILGQPFLATANSQIDCKTETVDMTFGNRRLRLHVFSGLMNPPVDDECYMANIVDTCIPLCDTVVDGENTMEDCYMFDRSQVEMDKSIDEEVKSLEVLAVREGKPTWTHQVESLPESIDTKLKPSLVEPPEVELKALSKHLKKLNTATSKDHFPLPSLTKLLRSCRGNNFIAS
ncbi:putative aspartic peptidase domain superfamily [Helianthus annuus]|nr:putative aspartic peptidase domain superfamily [Helianthus annuus]